MLSSTPLEMLKNGPNNGGKSWGARKVVNSGALVRVGGVE